MTKRGPYIFKRADTWVMLYREMVNEGGTLKAVQRAKPFCPASTPTKEARSLAKKELQKLEAGRPSRPELIVTLAGLRDARLSSVHLREQEAIDRGRIPGCVGNSLRIAIAHCAQAPEGY